MVYCVGLLVVNGFRVFWYDVCYEYVFTLLK